MPPIFFCGPFQFPTIFPSMYIKFVSSCRTISFNAIVTFIGSKPVVRFRFIAFFVHVTARPKRRSGRRCSSGRLGRLRCRLRCGRLGRLRRGRQSRLRCGCRCRVGFTLTLELSPTAVFPFFLCSISFLFRFDTNFRCNCHGSYLACRAT